jgi:threonylcarbamoyladenosine tRNA methylthiotransferase MtaB
MPEPALAPTAAILTLGCKLNIADSEAMALRLRNAGWRVTEEAAGADAVIVNSCSVTHVADHKSRHLVRLARRLAPEATVALTGCVLETASSETINALNADLVVKQPRQATLADQIIALHPIKAPSRLAESFNPQTVVSPALRTRAFISAQEGCNDVCAFCIVPRTRGRERSKAVEAIVAEARLREAEGAQEIVITGTQLGAYGRDFGQRDVYPVLAALLAETSVPRIRMSSLQPQDLSPRLIGLWRDKRLCRHLHLALQSGSESVLERMRRRYTAGEYRDAVAMLRGSIPGVAITTDVIAGFPGETDAEFEETYAFCSEMAFARMHVFPYSLRTGTAAAKMPGQLPDKTKKARVHRLLALNDELTAAYRSRFVGETVDVLWETRRDDGGATVWEGLTDTYVRVRAVSETNLTNRITPARVTALEGDGVRGEVTA